MAKTLRIEKMADLYLKWLYKAPHNNNGGFLHEYLDSKNIYHDAEILTDALALLTAQGLIREVPNTLAVISYDRSGDLMTSLGHVAGSISQCDITDKRFVEMGQELDKEGVAERKATWKTWRERVIAFIIALVTAVGVTLLTEPIKKWFQSPAPTKAVAPTPVEASSKPKVQTTNRPDKPSKPSESTGK